MNTIDMIYLVSVFCTSIVILINHKQAMVLVNKGFEEKGLVRANGPRAVLETISVLMVILIPILNTMVVINLLFNIIKLILRPLIKK